MTLRKSLLVGLAGLVVVVGMYATLTLSSREDPMGNFVDRAAEMGSHERLVAVMANASLSEFVSDGCSGGVSAMWRRLANQSQTLRDVIGSQPSWEHCCRAHDEIYHRGGSALTPEASFQARREADQALFMCIGNSQQSPRTDALANAIYLAVRTGGAPCTGFRWRWGYGYDDC